MNAEQQESIYYTNLRNINNIDFTNREIDIISFVLAGRATKKIAFFFSISPRTVEIHIRNIMAKLECNSRENIRDFIERSDKFMLVKNHYSNLLIKESFKQTLRKILNITKKNNINCLILYYKKQKKSLTFIAELEKSLTSAGVKTCSKILDKGSSINSLFNAPNLQQIDSILYVIPDETTETLQTTKQYLQEEVYKVISKIKRNQDPIIYLLLHDSVSVESQVKDPNFVYLSLTEQKNYYSMILSILQKVLSNNNIDEIVAEFHKNQGTLTDFPDLTKDIKEKDSLVNNNLMKIHFNYSKKMIWQTIIIFLLALSSSTVIFKSHKHKQIIENKTLVDSPSQTQNDNLSSSKDKTNIKKIKEIVLLNLPPRNSKFTGRDMALKQISTQMNSQKFGIITQAISGLGGVGKTQLATEFAYLAADKEEYSIILWIPTETVDAIGNAYKEIAHHLRLDIKGLDLDKMQTLVHNKLVSIYWRSKILLILDNASDYDNINDYIIKIHKELSPFLSTHILITSRSQYWPESPLILDVFTKIEALEFIQKYLPEENISSINRLTQSLHYLPLALSQAVSYIKRHTNINYYLKLYDSKQKEFLELFPADKNQYHESLWKTWNISLTKLSNVAKEFLFISACLNPDEIPLAFFNYLTIKQRENAIEELRKYSFITLIDNNKSFKIHRLLQEVIRFSINYNTRHPSKRDFALKTDSYWLIKAMGLLQTKFDFNYLQPKKWKYWSRYSSHAKTIASHAITIPGKTLHQGLKLYIKYAMFLSHIHCDGKNAITTWGKILALIQEYYHGQATQFIMANINTHLSYAKDYLGQLQESKELLVNTILPTYSQPPPKMQPELHPS